MLQDGTDPTASAAVVVRRRTAPSAGGAFAAGTDRSNTAAALSPA
jgi:hypothetical protein